MSAVSRKNMACVQTNHASPSISTFFSFGLQGKSEPIKTEKVAAFKMASSITRCTFVCLEFIGCRSNPLNNPTNEWRRTPKQSPESTTGVGDSTTDAIRNRHCGCIRKSTGYIQDRTSRKPRWRRFHPEKTMSKILVRNRFAAQP